MERTKNRELNSVVKIIVLLLVSVFLGSVISLALWKLFPGKVMQAGEGRYFIIYRFLIIFPFLCYIGLHFILDIKKMYSWMFEHRWLLAILFLIYTTCLRLHGDSIAYYSDVIQPNMGSGFGWTLFGNYRPIRSDEFLVGTPAVLASTYGADKFGMYNEILRGTNTLNILNGVYGGIATLICAPWEYAYLILPTEYAFSFCWYAPIVLGFMACLELFYIITRKNKLVSFVGACLVIFSSFYQWWTPSLHYIGGPGTIACLYYFIHSDKVWKKCILGFLTAISFGLFVTAIYPAWQVPLGYIFMVIGIWLIYDNWTEIRHFKGMDWIILAVSFIFCIGMIGLYFYSIREYTEIIGGTVYPGARFETGGDKTIHRLFYYVYAPFFPIKEFPNASEYGTFMSFFPLPSLLAAYCWLKARKKDFLTAGLLLIEIPMIIFLVVGLPRFLSLITLLFVSPPKRLQGMVGFIQILLIVLLLSRYKDTLKINKTASLLIAAANTALAFYYPLIEEPNYLMFGDNPLVKYLMIGLTFVLFSALVYGLITRISDKWKTISIVMLGIYSVVSGLMVRPISVGLGAITSKPVYKIMQKINSEEEDVKWLTTGGSPIFSAYSVASGSSTIDSVNTYPNLELWEKLDPEGEYNDIYNRYAHINLVFTDEKTSFELIQEDYMTLYLSYEDIQKTGADYVFANEGFEYNPDNGYIELDPVYSEAGVCVYKIDYVS